MVTNRTSGREDVGASNAYTGSDAERVIDARVWRRLATDSAYRNAASAEEQALREEQVTEQEGRAFYAGHCVGDSVYDGDVS